jgi:hypothetical protein
MHNLDLPPTPGSQIFSPASTGNCEWRRRIDCFSAASYALNCSSIIRRSSPIALSHYAAGFVGLSAGLSTTCRRSRWYCSSDTTLDDQVPLPSPPAPLHNDQVPLPSLPAPLHNDQVPLPSLPAPLHRLPPAKHRFRSSSRRIIVRKKSSPTKVCFLSISPSWS